MTEDAARRVDLDEVILVIDAQMPIRAKRVKYFEDPALKVLHAGQSGSFPYPDEEGLRWDRQMSETQETVEMLKQELMDVRAAAGANGSGVATSPAMAEMPASNTQSSTPSRPNRARGRAARAGASGGGPVQLSFDPVGLGLKEPDRVALAAAVQTTKAIIAEHS
nr:hypothetical protein [Seohaeicola zhoushanensis]